MRQPTDVECTDVIEALSAAVVAAPSLTKYQADYVVDLHQRNPALGRAVAEFVMGAIDRYPNEYAAATAIGGFLTGIDFMERLNNVCNAE